MFFFIVFFVGLASMMCEQNDPQVAEAWLQWLPLIMGTGQGISKANRQQKQAKEQDKFRREVIRYSPWTNMQDPGGMSAPSLLEGAIGGAGKGLMLGSGLGAATGTQNFLPEMFYNKPDVSKVAAMETVGPAVQAPAGATPAMGAAPTTAAAPVYGPPLPPDMAGRGISSVGGGGSIGDLWLQMLRNAGINTGRN